MTKYGSPVKNRGLPKLFVAKIKDQQFLDFLVFFYEMVMPDDVCEYNLGDADTFFRKCFCKNYRYFACSRLSPRNPENNNEKVERTMLDFKKLVKMGMIFSLLSGNAVEASEHHSGHAGMTGGGGSSAAQCQKARLERFNPPHLAKVAPGSEFSFYAFNIESPEQLSATVKKVPVELTAEFKEPYFLVKGRLPANLTKTAARIDIKASAKSSHCEEEKGWLLMIGE